eukprot:13038556-Alexandrium_andersonii.AAC.1
MRARIGMLFDVLASSGCASHVCCVCFQHMPLHCKLSEACVTCVRLFGELRTPQAWSTNRIARCVKHMVESWPGPPRCSC